LAISIVKTTERLTKLYRTPMAVKEEKATFVEKIEI